jgi:DNA-binding PadR family transcriptional regulator
LSTNTGKLTTSSYAILGLLAIRPWTTYELTQHMDPSRSVGRLWPRSRSKLYEEPKKLVGHGFAHASTDAVGRRSRTLYTITPAGRRALGEWLATPSEPPALESAHLLKLFYAEHGSKQAVLDTLADLGAWAEQDMARHAAVCRSYLAGLGPFPERAAVIILGGRFLADFADMVGRWAEWATDVVRAWPEDLHAAEPDWSVYAEIAGRAGDAVDRTGSSSS